MFCLRGTHNSILTVGSYLSSLGYSVLTIHILFFSLLLCRGIPVKSATFVRHKETVHECTAKSLTIEKNVTFMGLSLTIGYCGKCCGKRCIIRIGMEEGTVGFSYHVHFFSRQNRLEVIVRQESCES